MSYLSQKRFYWLDWFRFLAAFEVVACHARLGVWTHYDQIQASGKNWLTWIFFASTHLGNEAVVLFFVLSGYLVGGKVLQRTFDRSFDTSAYILDRVTRIYVPFLPALIVSGIIGYAIGARPLSLFEFLGNLAGLQSVCVHSYAGNLPLWSLSYEIWFMYWAVSWPFSFWVNGWGKLFRCAGSCSYSHCSPGSTLSDCFAGAWARWVIFWRWRRTFRRSYSREV